MDIITFLLSALVLKLLTQIGLDLANRKKINTLRPSVDASVEREKSLQKTRAYSLDSNRFSLLSNIYNAFLLSILLYTPLLKFYTASFQTYLPIENVFSQALFIFVFFLLYSLCFIPLELYKNFIIETKHGFNTMTFKLWVQDKIKLLIITALLLVPLLALLFSLPTWMGKTWWFYAAITIILFQLLISFIFPQFLLPLFNRLTPLKDGKLKTEIFALAKRLSFSAKDIFIMDGSKRSKHSNAFFTGIGKNRKIIFFDTLLQQLGTQELKAVFAHEVGHYKKKHLLKMLVSSTLKTFFLFYLTDFLLNYSSINSSFGLIDKSLPHLILLIMLFGSLFSFWLKPLSNLLSRKFEYEADAFAKESLNDGNYLISALTKLYQENLTNPNPHPIYSFFYHSHPNLQERSQSLLNH